MLTSGKKYILITGALVGWLAIILQLYLIIINRIDSVPETIIRFFSYFTVLTNILAASCYTFIWLNPTSKAGRFFSRPTTQTAIAVYITVVGIIYNTVLRSLRTPMGLDRIVNESLHAVLPLFFLLYWLIAVPKGSLTWVSVFPWLLYPFLYLVYVVIRGYFSGFYPYPFIDMNRLGYQAVLTNAIAVSLLFLLSSLLFVGTAKLINRRSHQSS